MPVSVNSGYNEQEYKSIIAQDILKNSNGNLTKKEIMIKIGLLNSQTVYIVIQRLRYAMYSDNISEMWIREFYAVP